MFTGLACVVFAFAASAFAQFLGVGKQIVAGFESPLAPNGEMVPFVGVVDQKTGALKTLWRDATLNVSFDSQPGDM
jgi:hypothetical protein